MEKQQCSKVPVIFAIVFGILFVIAIIMAIIWKKQLDTCKNPEKNCVNKINGLPCKKEDGAEGCRNLLGANCKVA